MNDDQAPDADEIAAPDASMSESAIDVGTEASSSASAVVAGSDVAIDPSDRVRIRGVAVVFVVLVLVAMAIGGAMSAVRGPQGPWLGEYYEGQDFEGDVRTRYARKIEFDWKKAAPFRGMPKDRWSVVYTTCLEVDEEEEYRFRLTSDDGSRLYIDGERIVDNWGPHSPRTRSGKYVLEPGTYELQVEYFEASHGAVLKLVVAIGEDGDHETLSPRRLRQPSDDPEDRCG